MTVRVALVDDQAMFRAGIAMVLDSQPDLEVVGQAEDGDQVPGLVAQSRPDVVVMDVRMSRVDGVTATRRLHDTLGEAAPRVLVLTTFDFDEAAVSAIEAGASGFVLKDAEPLELLRAVRVVAAGGSLLAPSVTRRVIEQFAGAGTRAVTVHPQMGELTEREREMVAWVATGRSNDEIAAELVISPATVRTHVSRAMIKLGARDRAQLVVFAIQSGLSAPDSN